MAPTLEETELLNHGWNAYGHLVDPIVTTNRHLAERIKEHYDLDEPHNRAIYETLLKFPDWHRAEPRR